MKPMKKTLVGLILVTSTLIVPILVKAASTSTLLEVKAAQLLAQQIPTSAPSQSDSTNRENAIQPVFPPSESALQELVNQNSVEVPVTQAEIQKAQDELGNPARTRQLSLRELALRRAITQHSKGEIPPGSNCQPYSRYFGHGCEAWCADFVSWAIDTADNHHKGHHNKRLPWSNPASVVSILNWGRGPGTIVKHPIPGDIFIIQGGGQSHIGFVKRVVKRVVKGKEKTFFISEEGNASDKVTSRERPLNLPHLSFVRFEADR